MIPPTFAKFKAGIKKHAALLRRHGLLNDRLHTGNYSARQAKKRLDDVPEPTMVAIQTIEHEAE